MRAAPVITLLLAHERTGTHMLRSLIARRQVVAIPGEICNAAIDIDGTTNPLAFFRFRRSLLLQDPALFTPSAAAADTIARAYFAMVATTMAAFDAVVLDIKYAHAMAFNDICWQLTDRPRLLDHARQARHRIVHLRRHPFDTAVSLLYAQQSGVWRARDPASLNPITIRIDPAELRRTARRVARRTAIVAGWLKSLPHLELTYETLAGPDATPALHALSDHIGAPRKTAYTATYIKTMPAYADAIANWPDLAPLRETSLVP